jgi:hypothetical protein
MSAMSTFVDNYKYGSHVSNNCQLTKDFVSHTVPVFSQHDGDEKVLPPKHCMTKTQTASVKISNYCKLNKKTENGTKVYDLKLSNYNKLIYRLMLCEDVVSSQHVSFSTRDDTINDYIVKVVPVMIWKDVNTSMKELYMTYNIYHSTYLTCKGFDIACKPFFGCLFWSGKQWKYLSIYEKAIGCSMSFMKRQRYFNGDFNKEQVLLSASNAITTLWTLGFAHNDLCDKNLIYNSKTHTIKMLDFKMAVRLPVDTTTRLVELLYPKKWHTVKINQVYCDNIAKVFENNAKEVSISLLSLAADICHLNIDEDGFTYNTDEHFLPMLYKMLS